MKNTAFPDYWERPKYHLGQRVKQGEIIGVEYNSPFSRRGYQLGEGWTYTVLPDEHSDDIDNIRESEVRPLTTEELRSEIQADIDFYQSNVTALLAQLGEVEA